MVRSDYCMSGVGVGKTIATEPQLECDHDNLSSFTQRLKAGSIGLGESPAATANPELSPESPKPWDIDPNHGMHIGPGYLGDAPHSLRAREVFR